MARTKHLVALAVALVDGIAAERGAYELARSSGVRSGVLYPLLSRMVEAGWLADRWLDADPAVSRPRRRVYSVTDCGAVELGAIVASAHAIADRGRLVGCRPGSTAQRLSLSRIRGRA